jgi:hypothetical protein
VHGCREIINVLFLQWVDRPAAAAPSLLRGVHTYYVKRDLTQKTISQLFSAKMPAKRYFQSVASFV